MSEVPLEAVEFARMAVRAFYPSEFVILLDAILRLNNYCAHPRLAQRLGVQPKELRQILNRMTHARLVRSDKRTQKKVNINDDRRPTRTMTTEFWYVPLGAIVDCFLFRIHKITTDLDDRKKSELDRQKHECGVCHTVYDLLDILSFQMTNTKLHVCEKMGVRYDRRPLPCGGIIREQDNSAKIKELETTKQMVVDELRELRERAALLATMELPNHPLTNASTQKWNEIAPEVVGMHGEKVDEDGAPVVDQEAERRATAAEAKTKGADKEELHVDDNAIPDKPSWFKESAVEEGDDEWDFEQDNLMNTKKGTAASFNQEEEKAYLERYMLEVGVTPAATAPTAAATPKSSSTAPATTVGKAGDAKAGGVGKSKDAAKDATKNAAKNVVKKGGDAMGEAVDDGANDVMVTVAGKQVALSQVTEEMTDTMTAGEYTAYFALARRNASGGDDDDDDDEFD